MGRLIVFCAMVSIAALSPAPAKALSPEAGALGAGISLGAPLSVTGKYFLTSARAIDAHIGGIPFFKRGYHGSLVIAVDLLQDLGAIYETESLRIGVYGGVGAAFLYNAGDVRIYDPRDAGLVPFYDVAIAARVPVGVNIFLSAVPVELGFEVSPALAVHLHTRVQGRQRASLDLALFNAALSARYYFR